MTPDTARQAASLIERIDQAIASNAIVTLVQAQMPNGGQVSVFAGALDADRSAQGLQFTRQIYQAQLDSLNAELAAL
jgi:hypothetical protein